jgi:ketosteroid isomerase-like protein
VSEGNVEVVRVLFEAFGRGGTDEVLALAEPYLDPEVEWLQPPEDVEGEVTHRGLDDVRRFFEQWFEAFADFAVELDGVRDAGEMVVAFVHEHGRGRTSGLEVDWRVAYVFSLRDGKVVRLERFWDRAAALNAAEVSE